MKASKRWTYDEEKVLEDNKYSHTYSEIAVILNRTKNSIARKFQAMKIRKRKVLNYMNLESTILAYTAGIIDGEGHIAIRRSFDNKYYSLAVEVSNTSTKVMEFMRIHFGGSIMKGQRPNRKPFYRWMVATRQAAEVLRAVYPYLVIKKNQAELAFEFRTNKDKNTLAEQFLLMKKLHRYD